MQTFLKVFIIIAFLICLFAVMIVCRDTIRDVKENKRKKDEKDIDEHETIKEVE